MTPNRTTRKRTPEHAVEIAGEHAHPRRRRHAAARQQPAQLIDLLVEPDAEPGIWHPGRRPNEHHERDHGEQAERHPEREPGRQLVVVGQGFAHLQQLVEGDQHPPVPRPGRRSAGRAPGRSPAGSPSAAAPAATGYARCGPPAPTWISHGSTPAGGLPLADQSSYSVISRSSSPRGRKSSSGLASVVSNSRKWITTSLDDCPASAPSPMRHQLLQAVLQLEHDRLGRACPLRLRPSRP